LIRVGFKKSFENIIKLATRPFYALSEELTDTKIEIKIRSSLIFTLKIDLRNQLKLSKSSDEREELTTSPRYLEVLVIDLLERLEIEEKQNSYNKVALGLIFLSYFSIIKIHKRFLNP
jgi:hypothetical protein